MKKKLIFCLCIILSIIICMSTVPFSAYNYDCDVEITSSAVLVVNTDTGTVVYDKNSNVTRYSSYLSNIMTYIVARTNIADVNKRITITQDMLSLAENSDGSLKKFLNHTLTIKDLLYYLIMTDGTDAAYILADYVSNGDIDAFVELMNKKAVALGCTKTKFSAPGVKFDASQVTTCRDMLKIVQCALDTPDYKEIAGTATYMPEKYKNTALEFDTNNSIIKSKSPYYFKYIKNGKYGYDEVARGNIVAQSVYKDVTYICIILGADSLNEHNAFTETKQLLTWTYTKLGNKQIIAADDILATVSVDTAWGNTVIGLTAGKDITRTMPADFSLQKLTYEYNPNGALKPPVFEGQNVGTANVYYEGEFFEEIDLVSNSSYGVGIVDDMTDFIGTMFNQTFSQGQTDTDIVQTEDVTVDSTGSKEKSTVASQTKPTTAPTQAVNSTQAVQ